MSRPVVTIFGATGFVGRFTVRAFVRAGFLVRAVTRHPQRAYFLKTEGSIGQVTPFACSAQNPAAIKDAVTGADCVVYLPGLLYERGANSFERVHVSYPQAVATACADAGVKKFIFISAAGIDASPSRYAATKRAGEAAVKQAFPATVIMRPSIIFGPEDGFFGLFAKLSGFLPALPLIGGGKTRFQPVYVGDVADAIMAASTQPHASGTYELGGPEVADFKNLMQRMMQYTGRAVPLVSIPFALAKLEAFFLQFWPKPLLTPDQVDSLKADSVVASDAQTLADLGIAPTSMDMILPQTLARFKPGGKFGDKKRVA